MSNGPVSSDTCSAIGVAASPGNAEIAVDVAATPAVSSIAFIFLSSKVSIDDECTSIDVAYLETTVNETIAITRSTTAIIRFFAINYINKFI